MQENLWQVYWPFHWTEVLSKDRKVPALLTFIVLGLVLAVLPSIWILTKGWSVANNIEPFIKQTVDQLYPDNLVVTIKNGELSTNVREPYFIALPKTITGIFGDAKNFQKDQSVDLNHFITIDTKASVEDFDKYNTYILVSKRFTMYYRNSDSKEKTIKTYDSTTNGVVTKSMVLDGENQMFAKHDFGQILRVVLVFVPLFFVAGSIMLTVVTVLITTLYVAFMAKVRQDSYSLEKLFAYSLACGTLVMLVVRVIHIFLPGFGDWSNLPHWITLGFAMTGLQLAKLKKENHQVEPAQVLYNIFILPIVIAKDLLDSTRSSGKKLVLGAIWLFFFLIPWIGEIIATLSTLTSAFGHPV